MFLSDNNTVIVMEFNETTKLLGNFSKDNILVYITGPRDYYEFSFDWLNTKIYQGTGVTFTS
jgi:hypothetical protein